MSAIPELENVPEVDTVKPSPEQPPIAPVQAVESIPEQPEVTQSGTTVRSEQQYMSPKPQGTIALRHEGSASDHYTRSISCSWRVSPIFIH